MAKRQLRGQMKNFKYLMMGLVKQLGDPACRHIDGLNSVKELAFVITGTLCWHRSAPLCCAGIYMSAPVCCAGISHTEGRGSRGGEEKGPSGWEWPGTCAGTGVCLSALKIYPRDQSPNGPFLHLCEH